MVLDCLAVGVEAAGPSCSPAASEPPVGSAQRAVTYLLSHLAHHYRIHTAAPKCLSAPKCTRKRNLQGGGPQQLESSCARPRK